MILEWDSLCCVLLLMILSANADEGVPVKFASPPPEVDISWFDYGIPESDHSSEFARTVLLARLDDQLNTIERICGLSKAQRTKLHLAGRGDINWWLNRAEELQMKVVQATRRRDQAKLNELLEEAGIACMDGSNLTIFPWNADRHDRPRSLFCKTIMTCLSEQQREMLERDQMITATALMMRSGTPPDWKKTLTEIESHHIAGLIMDHCPQATDCVYSDPFTLFLHAAEFENQLKPQMTQHEWVGFQAKIAQARVFEQSLRDLGHWPLKPPKPKPDRDE